MLIGWRGGGGGGNGVGAGLGRVLHELTSKGDRKSREEG